MRIKAKPDRPDYSAACKMTVTLYNKIGGKNEFVRTVFHNSAYLQSERIYRENKTGVSPANSVLLVIPQGADGNKYVTPAEFDSLENKAGYFTLRNGDKACYGEGIEITTPEEWAAFIPAKNANAVIISAVDVLRTLGGEIAHIEGGGN